LTKGKVSARNLSRKVACVFLDRDGTLTRETDYVRRTEDLELIEGAGSAVSKINSSGMLAVLTTNQPVIARGDVSEDGLRTIHNKLETLLGADRAFLDAIYFCPHHPDRGFKGERTELKIQCDCRKPGIAMIEWAAREHNIDLSSSWFVGDTTTDMLTARNAGVKSVLVRTGFGGRDRKYPARPDFEVSGITEAVDFIAEDYERIRRLLEPVVKVAGPESPFVIAGPARSGKSLVAATLRQMWSRSIIGSNLKINAGRRSMSAIIWLRFLHLFRTLKASKVGVAGFLTTTVIPEASNPMAITLNFRLARP
jgi:D,D-heptose 1,7-bisphosphate phosphatase